jgi:hypothetical protein
MIFNRLLHLTGMIIAELSNKKEIVSNMIGGDYMIKRVNK